MVVFYQASVHTVTTLKPGESLSIMDTDDREDRDIVSFLSDLCKLVSDATEALKSKCTDAQSKYRSAQHKIETLTAMKDKAVLETNQLNKSLGGHGFRICNVQ